MVTATRRERSVLKVEEAAMNVTAVGQDLTEKHDPPEARIWAGIIDGLEALRPYVACESVGMQYLEHTLLLARLGQREDRKENAAHTYIVGQSQVISEWTQERERPSYDE